MADKNFCWEVARGIVDEIQAQEYYAELIKQTNDEALKEMLTGIMKQENEHMKKLNKLFQTCST